MRPVADMNLFFHRICIIFICVFSFDPSLLDQCLKQLQSFVGSSLAPLSLLPPHTPSLALTMLLLDETQKYC